MPVVDSVTRLARGVRGAHPKRKVVKREYSRMNEESFRIDSGTLLGELSQLYRI